MRNFRLPALFLLCLSLLGTRAVAQQTVGLFATSSKATDGYTLLGPLSSSHVYLIDNCGRSVQDWSSAYVTGTVSYLQPDGQLLHTCRVPNTHFPVGGLGGRIELLDWASNVSWSYTVSSNTEAQHHDAILLPNGNYLMVVWEAIDSASAVAEGRNPATLGAELWPDKLIEVTPVGPDSGTIVWEWHAWDHLIQDFDSTKNNYGVVGDHPELFDVNYYDPTSEVNWMHVNGIAYNASLDQIVLSSHRFDEIWIIDHSTTTAQAASHSGGLRGHGGDLLYRFGNPQTYRRGTVADQRFFGQHNIHWVPAGDSYENQLAVFNNGFGRPDGTYSMLEIFDPPLDSTGNYTLAPGQPYGPAGSSWRYVDSTNFFSLIISGLQRLPHDQTLVCEGTSGHIFELDSLGNIVWDYVNPVGATGPVSQGDTIPNNYVFRAYHYLPDFAGFAGHNFAAGAQLEGNPLPLPQECLASNVEELVLEEAQIFPNPFSATFTIRHSQKRPVEVRVCDLQGRICLRQTISEKEATISANDLPSGLYLVQVDGYPKAVKLQKF